MAETTVTPTAIHVVGTMQHEGHHMKKVLFASTALVAFAGAAAAEVTISGSATMGLIVGDGGNAPTDSDVEFLTDIDVTFTMSGETDGGLSYGANIDLDESDGSNVTPGVQTIQIPNTNPPQFITVNTVNAANGASPAFAGRTQGGESIFISGAFGTLTAGDTDGALDWGLQEVAFNSGSLNDDETGHAGWNGNAGLDGTYDGQIVRYDYSVGDFGIAVSAEIADNSGNDPILGIGVKYSLDLAGVSGIGLGAGYQVGEDIDAYGASINGTVYGLNVGVSFLKRESDLNLASDYEHIGVGIGYVNEAISLSANYGNYDLKNGGADSDGFGVTAGYDLGGGAQIQAGYGNSNPAGAADFETFSFGVRMSF